MDKNSFDVQYIICECGDNFPNEKLLNLHLAYNHADVDTFQCEHCLQIFPTAQLYKHHIKQHSVQKPENKPSQNLKTYSKISKTDTSPENVKKEPKSPPVIKLEDEWSPVSELLQVAPDVAAEEIAETDNVSVAAISSSSEEDEERYHKCNVCHKIFASEEFYLRHHNKVHANRPPAKNNTKVTEERSPDDRSKGDPLQPTQSSIEAVRGTKPVDEAVTEPIKREETKVLQKAPEEVTYFKCDVCKILYPTEKAYSVHYKKKHGGAQFGFQLIEQDLEGPYLTPPPPKQDEVRCELCNRTFANERSYRVHFGRVHCPQRLQSPNHECEMCGKKCFSNAALMYHRRTHTGEKPYQCSQCMKKFRGYEHLRIHIRTHTGERPFMCTRCPKTFMRKSALSRHDLVHTGEKPYSCPHCGKCFSQSNGMKSHVNTVHLKLPGPFRHRRKRNQ